MQRLRLLDTLKQRGFHSSVATTYSVDGGFYDGAIQHRLRAHDCLNNILIADASMLRDALRATPECFARAGSRYAVVPVSVSGCFHPKILLRLGTDRARLHVASANTTAAGWCRNAELTCDVSWEHRSEHPDNVAFGRIMRKAYGYLSYWLDEVSGQSVAAKLRIHARDASWLVDLEPNTAPITLSDGTALDLLLENGGGGRGILERFADCVAGDRIRRIVAISPYWDVDAAALKDLSAIFDQAPITVAVNKDTSEFPAGADLAGVNVHFAAALHEDRFTHAKLIVLESATADHVLVGSANVSRAALGAPGIPARNAEASVYRRLPRGAAATALGLDLTHEVPRSSIRAARAGQFAAGAGCLTPGTAEIEGFVVTWWPARGIEVAGAMLIRLGGEEAVTPSGNGTGEAILSTRPRLPLVVRFRLADGRETDPVIVHDHGALRVGSPGSYGPLTDPMYRLEQGDDDIIDLAHYADMLFDRPAPSARGGGGGDRKTEDDTADVEYADEESFRKATELPRCFWSRGGGIGGHDLWNATLLRLGMGCLVGAVDPAAELRKERREAAEILAGEEEDGVDEGRPAREGAELKLGQAEPPLPDPAEDRATTARQMAKRRRSLVRALTLFESWLAAAAADHTIGVDDVPAKVSFILRLMGAAMRVRHCMGDGSILSLMAMEPVNEDRMLSVAVQSVAVLRDVWLGRWSLPPVVQRLNADTRRARIPMEVSRFAVFCRWITARCVRGIEQHPEHARLALLLERTATRIVTATFCLGFPDPSEETRLLVQLEESEGGSAAEGEAVAARLWRLAPSVSGQHSPSDGHQIPGSLAA